MLAAAPRTSPRAASARALLLLAAALLGGARPAPAQEADPPARVLEVGEARIRVILPEHRLDVGETALLDWIGAAAHAVADYEGRFPVGSATVRIRSHGGRGVGQGRAQLVGTPEIQVSVGQETRPEDLRRDWVMTHEMIHLGFPSVGGHCWMEEGLATYLEPVVRARAGALPAEEVWGKLAVLLPKGLPKVGDGGLDEAPTGPRTYWGGAIFWLAADVEIRARTHGRRGLDDVLRAIVASGGTICERWDVERVIATGDRTAGVPVLRRLYRRMATSPDHGDLDRLWRSLGVRHEHGRVVLDDGAPLAPVRRAITRAEGARPVSRAVRARGTAE